jgi:predicted nucleic acid-binding protein
MTRIYLDACSIIYLAEAASPFHDALVRRLKQHQADADSRLITSRLSCLECRVRPIRNNDQKLLADYDRFFAASRLEVVEISADVVERATVLPASYGFKTPDAIHLASAIEAKAEIFLTGDNALTRCTEVMVEVLENT